MEIDVYDMKSIETDLGNGRMISLTYLKTLTDFRNGLTHLDLFMGPLRDFKY